MCPQAPQRQEPTRPRWWRLYATTALALAVFALPEVAGMVGAPKLVLEGVAIAAAFGGMARWVWRNRVAIEQAEWCACASRTVTIRVIESRPPAAADGRHGDDGQHAAPTPAEAPHGATLEV